MLILILCNTICFRFDSELRKVNESLKVEKSERDSLKRAKDEITAEKNTLQEINKVYYFNLNIFYIYLIKLSQFILCSFN